MAGRSPTNESLGSSRDDARLSTTARETAEKVTSAVNRKAADQAESVRQQTSDGLAEFAGAIRHAGDELAEKDQGAAAQLLSKAAGGLEQLSAALSQKRIDDIVSDVRKFGQQHPGAFMMGSVLVGIALGRFAQTAVQPSSDGSHNPSFAPRSSPTFPDGTGTTGSLDTTPGGANELK